MLLKKFFTCFIVGGFVFFCNVLSANALIYVTDEMGKLYEYDLSTKSSTLIADTGIGTVYNAFYDIALNPSDGLLYGITGYRKFYSINPSTGAINYIGTASAFINGLTFDSSGTLYGSGLSKLYTIDIIDAAVTLIGDTGFTSSGDLAFDSNGNLYMTAYDSNANGDQLILVDKTTGQGTKIGDIGYKYVFGLSFIDSILYGFTYYKDVITINTSTGKGSLFDSKEIVAYGAAGKSSQSLPEPPAFLLIICGFLIAVCFLRKRCDCIT